MSAPADHVRGELLAHVMGSEQSFFDALTCVPVGGSAGKRLWRQLESTRREVLHGFMLDDLQSLRDEVLYSGHPEADIPLERLLRRHGEDCLREAGDDAVLTLRQDDGRMHDHSLQRWMWLTWSVPGDLLLAAAFPEPGPTRVRELDPLLCNRLGDCGYAQTHVHVGAEMTFGQLWVACQAAIAQPRFARDAMASPGAVFDDGRDFAAWLICGAIVRCVLGRFLFGPSPRATFDAFLSEVFADYAERYGASLGWTLTSAFRHLEGPASAPDAHDYRWLQWCYRGLIGRPRNPGSLGELDELDPLGRGVVSEIHFVRAAFDYLGRRDCSDRFRLLFWQVVRLRTLVFRHITQRPLIAGLNHFIRFYLRLSPLKKPLGKVMVESALQLEGAGRGLRSLEIRTAPAKDVSELKDELRTFVASFLRTDAPARVEFGLVLHLIKMRSRDSPPDPAHPNWRNTHASPDYELNATGVRYSHIAADLLRNCHAVEGLLAQVPTAVLFLRGFDICNDELALPTWLTAPLVKQMLAAHATASRIASSRLGVPVDGPRCTAHAGEDFRHVTEGLRRIDESLRFVGLRPGDRIGHGLALGVAPLRWADASPGAWMPREERLWDLIWERACYRCGAADEPPGRLARIEREAEHHLSEVFGQRLALAEGEALYEQLAAGWGAGAPPTAPLNMAGFHSRGDDGERQPLLSRYLMSSEVFTRCYDTVEVCLDAQELEAVTTLQHMMRRRVARSRITVEVNPSSNVLIADLRDVAGHPMWRLRPPVPIEGAGPPVDVCVGDDDPVTFATSLPREYELLYDFLVGSPLVGESDARSWVDQVRQSGLDARFTLPLQVTTRERWHELLDALTPGHVG